jgi:glycosyltransferase involved in cell wall biosynthesis
MDATIRRRVGLVIGQLTYGGAESQLCELARGLRAECDVFVYCLSEKDRPYGPKLREAGVPVEVIAATGSFDLARVVRLARSLHRDRIDVVHAFLFIASAYAYLATRLARRMRLVTSARNCKPEPNAVRRWIMKRAFKRSDAIICNSSEMARFASAYYAAPAGRITVVYNGVDTQRFDAARPAPSAERLTIGTIGRLEPQKNLDAFLEAAACVHAVRPEARFHVVGEGSERARLETRTSTLGLAGVVSFEGTTGDVAGFLATLDQFWLTSDWEGTPNVVLEAMAAGVPIIATRVGGVPELLEDGRTGLLVEAGDASALCSASLFLAREPARAGTLGQGAREVVLERFSLSAMVAATARVYDRAAEGQA